MRVLGEIYAVVDKKEEDDKCVYLVIVKDVQYYYHTLFFREQKIQQLLEEYDADNIDDIVGEHCIVEEYPMDKGSHYIQSSVGKDKILADKDGVDLYGGRRF